MPGQTARSASPRRDTGLPAPTYGADFHMDGEDGVGAGRVLVHEGVTHCSVPPAHLHDPLALDHAVHSVQRKPLHIHPLLWVLLQLQTGTRQHRSQRDTSTTRRHAGSHLQACGLHAFHVWRKKKSLHENLRVAKTLLLVTEKHETNFEGCHWPAERPYLLTPSVGARCTQ